ncbi:hypothetical protein ARMGADRAFT_447334 [Armillaria gallica]|uniref:Uncharacterized protein n=1 Tax=Armillaria gallica TaxID=47427 RepID=A0A2H3CX47_ARMGA|nr:hypothetical protein ARMGADRAFT_447334 [Armillaria gallica]
MSLSNTRPSCLASHVLAAVNGDLARYLQLLFGPVAARHSHRRRLGNPPARSPIADRRFRINATEYAKYTLLVYTSDIQNPTGIDEESRNINEAPSRRHIDYCKVFFNCGLVNFLLVQSDDIPLLPF